ncbi:MAG: metallophosphoesterase [Deltaproteobacteria bacterium]|nr:metallophosphoesterase [Deltaproteobacteria bacterium]
MRSLFVIALAALAACTHHEAGEKSPRNGVELGPWLLDPQPTSMTVAWTTPLKTVGSVSYGQAGALDKKASEAEATVDHRVVITGLTPGDKFEYRIDGEVPVGGSFTTAPPAEGDLLDKPFRVLIYGDNRTNGGDHALVVRAAGSEHAVLALHTGDMVVDAKQPKAWATWFAVERDLLAHTPIVPTVGNHEITDHGVTYSRHFKDAGRPTFRALQYGTLHVLVLDSFEQAAGAEPHHGAVSDAQRAWAEAEAKSIPKDHQLWVLVHQGPFAHPVSKRPGHGGSEAVKALIHAVDQIHHVAATFAGHEHFYERGVEEGLTWFVLGGGGAPLDEPDATFPSVQRAAKALSYMVVDVCGCHAIGRAKDITGKTFDEFVLGDCPQACTAPTSAFQPIAQSAADAGTADAGAAGDAGAPAGGAVLPDGGAAIVPLVPAASTTSEATPAAPAPRPPPRDAPSAPAQAK